LLPELQAIESHFCHAGRTKIDSDGWCGHVYLLIDPTNAFAQERNELCTSLAAMTVRNVAALSYGFLLRLSWQRPKF
jgi:hypothetical protein